MRTKQKNWNKSILMTSAAAICFAAGAPMALGADKGSKDVTDMGISNHIDTEMIASDAVDSYKIDLTADKGIVTLTGKVSNLQEKRRAVDIARATVGVRGVIDRITVQEMERSDAEVRKDVQDALLADPATESYQIDTAIRNGQVTLTGTVDSYAERMLADDVVASVRGVMGINNDLIVEYDADRTDAEIRGDVKGRLANTVHVDDGLIDISVKDGKVKLTGTVGSAAEKWKARSLAWVAGVTDVKHEDLEVKWWARDDMLRKDQYVSKSDSEIRNAVQDAFLYDPRVNSFNPDVTVSGNVVTLTGTVDNAAARTAADQIARNIIGVYDVENHLRVKGDEIADERLEVDIRQALLRDSYTDRFDFNVEVINGHAHLYGDVDTRFEKVRATHLAERVPGIVNVSNSAAVLTEWTPTEDWELKEDIESEYFWSPFVDGTDVFVTVDDGKAVLSGTVDTMSERRSAAQNAYEAGARYVDNDLKVRYGPKPLMIN